MLLCSIQSFSQDDSDPVQCLRDNAIPIENLSELDHGHYEEIREADFVMIGEMHGTWEPAMFALGLAKLIARQEGRVILALEIRKASINEESLLETEFFRAKNFDGRNGEAWFSLISQASKVEGIQLAYIDNGNAGSKDSSMFLDLWNLRDENPGVKILTLSGNIHNWIKPFRDRSTMGSLLEKKLADLGTGKLISINHIYKEGTMMNNKGSGLELSTVSGKDNFLNTTIDADNYLCKTLFEAQDQYTHFLFTEKVTHSDVIKK